MAKVLLKCVSERGKLRIKFHSFITEDDKEFLNVYNNSYNCRFPKNIRRDGLFYEVGPNDITLSTSAVAPYYIINKSAIKIIDTIQNVTVDDIKIYAETNCVICLDEEPVKVFVPCGHRCLCSDCYDQYKAQKKNTCVLCRRKILSEAYLFQQPPTQGPSLNHDRCKTDMLRAPTTPPWLLFVAAGV